MGGWVGGWVEGVVYDLPVEGQEEEEEEKVVGWVSGSFLTEGEMAEKLATHPPTLFLMKHVLHDWGDEACVTILRNVRQAMLLPSSSSSSSSSCSSSPKKLLVLFESLLDTNSLYRSTTHLFKRLNAAMDVAMLAMTGEGKERYPLPPTHPPTNPSQNKRHCIAPNQPTHPPTHPLTHPM